MRFCGQMADTPDDGEIAQNRVRQKKSLRSLEPETRISDDPDIQPARRYA
jgi:hypothetical protein